MPRVCTICTHPQRKEIEAAFLSGKSFRKIGEQYSVGDNAVRRHKLAHMPKTKRKLYPDLVSLPNKIGKLWQIDGFVYQEYARNGYSTGRGYQTYIEEYFHAAEDAAKRLQNLAREYDDVSGIRVMFK